MTHTSHKPLAPQRDRSLDALRGLAIVAMIGANLVGYITPLPLIPAWFRIAISLTAPLFLVLAGYMVAVNTRRKERPLSYYAVRGGLLVLTQIMLDIFFWKQVPLIECDILYILALGGMLVHAMEKKAEWVKWIAIAILLGMAFLFQHIWEYKPELPDFSFVENDNLMADIRQTSILNLFLYNGYFPIFPWLAFPLLGSVFARVREKSKNRLASPVFAIFGAALAVAGFAWLYLTNTSQYGFDLLCVREDYAELFYPPSVPFLVGTLGGLLLIFSLADKTARSPLWRPFHIFGECSLFNYILHSMVISAIIYPCIPGPIYSLNTGWAAYALLLLFCFVMSVLANKLKQNAHVRTLLFRFFLGG